MEIIQERLLGLRESVKLSQAKLSNLIGVSQAAINRYENGDSLPNAAAIAKYADFFDVSADYIIGRCDEPQGKLYAYQPEFLRDRLANSDDWRDFVEMCFDLRSPMNARLKEMLLQMMGAE